MLKETEVEPGVFVVEDERFRLPKEGEEAVEAIWRERFQLEEERRNAREQRYATTASS